MISVVTALKDGFEYFAKTLPTVLSQTHAEWEWLIIDDGSATPLSQAFPELLVDPRVTIIRFEHSRGQTIGLNEGIKRSKWDWIVRVDADDLFTSNRFVAIADAILAGKSSKSPKLIFSDYDVIDENGLKVSTIRYRQPLSESFFKYLEHQNNSICHPSVAFYKFAPNAQLYQYREDLRNAQDYELWKRIVKDWKSDSVKCIDQPLVQYRVVSSSLSGAMALEQRGELLAIRGKQPITPGQKRASILDANQRNGMQAYRLLYYRWLDYGSHFWTASDLRLYGNSLRFTSNVIRATFYLLTKPMSVVLKRSLFGGSYL